MSKGVQIWVAPTADDSDGWLATMRHIAIESGAFVISLPQYIESSGVPRRLSGAAAGRRGLRARRSRDHRAARGCVIAGPLYDEEGIVTADIDLKVGLHAKRWFDVVGHYSRIPGPASAGRERRPVRPFRPTPD